MTTPAGTPADPPADDEPETHEPTADGPGPEQPARPEDLSGDEAVGADDLAVAPRGDESRGTRDHGADDRADHGADDGADDGGVDAAGGDVDDDIGRELARLAEVLDPATVVELEPEDDEHQALRALSSTGVPAPDAADGRGEDVPPGTTPADGPDADAGAPGAGSGAGAIDPVVGSALDGWRVLARGLRPRATKGQLLAGLLCAVLGFALAVQVRQTATVNLSTLRQEDLLRILDEATTRGDDLASEVSALEHERNQLLSDGDTQEAARDAARRTAIAQGILTGRLPAQGPGVTVTITDPGGTVKPATLLNFMEELRNAGSEAIELNDLRVTASSAFTGDAGAVVLDGIILSPPYRWTVIGDPDTIAPALEIPGGAVATVRGNGGAATVEQQDLVTIDALRTTPEPSYATPVPPATG